MFSLNITFNGWFSRGLGFVSFSSSGCLFLSIDIHLRPCVERFVNLGYTLHTQRFRFRWAIFFGFCHCPVYHRTAFLGTFGVRFLLIVKCLYWIYAHNFLVASSGSRLQLEKDRFVLFVFKGQSSVICSDVDEYTAGHDCLSVGWKRVNSFIKAESINLNSVQYALLLSILRAILTLFSSSFGTHAAHTTVSLPLDLVSGVWLCPLLLRTSFSRKLLAYVSFHSLYYRVESVPMTPFKFEVSANMYSKKGSFFVCIEGHKQRYLQWCRWLLILAHLCVNWVQMRQRFDESWIENPQ